MLGLKYGTVRLVDHDAGWSQAFVSERAVLIDALDGLGAEIEHIGSTAVPGLRAKPILAYIRLRELLRADPVAREMYSAGKEELARRFADDRKAYTKAKEPLVDRVLIRATAQ